MKLLTTAAAAVVVLAAAGAQALPLLVDDFNDGSTDGWTTRNGSVSEAGGLFTGTGNPRTFEAPLATLDGFVASTIGVDAVIDAESAYVALVLNFTSLADNLFVKVQDDDSDGLLDYVYFLHGNNGVDGLGGASRFELSSQVAATYFQVTDHGDGTVSAWIQATGDTFGGTLTNAYTGTGVGLGFVDSGGGNADNFYVLPEPGTLTLVALGMLGLGWLRRS